MASPLQQKLEVEAKAFQQFQNGECQHEYLPAIHPCKSSAGSIMRGGFGSFHRTPNVLAGEVFGCGWRVAFKDWLACKMSHRHQHEPARIFRAILGFGPAVTWRACRSMR